MITVNNKLKPDDAKYKKLCEKLDGLIKAKEKTEADIVETTNTMKTSSNDWSSWMSSRPIFSHWD